MSLAIWIRDLWGSTVTSPRSREAFGILFFYFYGLVFGALAILIAAFLLRRIMTLLKCKTPLHWAAVAAVLAPVLVAALGEWAHGCRAAGWTGPARSCCTVRRWYFRQDSGWRFRPVRNGIFTLRVGARSPRRSLAPAAEF
jgi:hypothetical protein